MDIHIQSVRDKRTRIAAIESGETIWDLELDRDRVGRVVVDDDCVFIEEEEAFSAHHPRTGVASQGETLHEAKQMLAEAVTLQDAER